MLVTESSMSRVYLFAAVHIALIAGMVISAVAGG
jgi:hypothetical protein